MSKDLFHILVVDDAAEIRESLVLYLQRQGYSACAAASVAQARVILKQQPCQLILLDIMMPDEDGLSFCRSLAQQEGPAVILVSALSSDSNKIRGLDYGADDYIAKPFNPRELLSRIGAVLRRVAPEPPGAETAPPPGQRRSFAGFLHDPQARTLRQDNGPEQRLTTGENRLLEAMLARPGSVFRREEITALLQPGSAASGSRAADNCILRLRRKLGDDARAPVLLVTEWGGGYRLNAGDITLL